MTAGAAAIVTIDVSLAVLDYRLPDFSYFHFSIAVQIHV